MPTTSSSPPPRLPTEYYPFKRRQVPVGHSVHKIFVKGAVCGLTSFFRTLKFSHNRSCNALPIPVGLPKQLTRNVGRKTICSAIHKLAGSISKQKELLQQWKQSITVSFYNKAR